MWKTKLAFPFLIVLSKYSRKLFGWLAKACKSSPFWFFRHLLKRGGGGEVPGWWGEPKALDRVPTRLWGDCGRTRRVAQTRYAVIWQHLVGNYTVDNEKKFHEVWDLVVHGVLDAHAVWDEERRVRLSHIKDLHHLNLGGKLLDESGHIDIDCIPKA